MSSDKNQWVSDAEERGYRDALLDVYLFLTGNELALDIDTARFGLIAAMTEQVTAKSTGRLREVELITP